VARTNPDRRYRLHGRSEQETASLSRISPACAAPAPDLALRSVRCEFVPEERWRSAGVHWSRRRLCHARCQRRRWKPAGPSRSLCRTTLDVAAGTCPAACGLARAASWTRQPLVSAQRSRAQRVQTCHPRWIPTHTVTGKRTDPFCQRRWRLCLSPQCRAWHINDPLVRHRLSPSDRSVDCSRNRGRKVWRDR